jgi:GTP-sensing pleiotropic transcriptional regulator CodY
MKECEVASIVSQGMKGTHIKILEPSLRTEAKELTN